MDLESLIQHSMPFPHALQLNMSLDRRLDKHFRNWLPTHIFIGYKETNQATERTYVFLIIYKTENHISTKIALQTWVYFSHQSEEKFWRESGYLNKTPQCRCNLWIIYFVSWFEARKKSCCRTIFRLTDNDSKDKLIQIQSI